MFNFNNLSSLRELNTLKECEAGFFEILNCACCIRNISILPCIINNTCSNAILRSILILDNYLRVDILYIILLQIWLELIHQILRYVYFS